MSVQNYTPVMNVLETLKSTTCRPKSNPTFHREFEHLQGDSMEISASIYQKEININTLI